jgi:dethiobiotin synthetase
VNAVFITGTDTSVGKTVAAGLLARYLLDKGFRAITQKLIQTGAALPDDVAVHWEFMNKKEEDIKKLLPFITPYTFKLPASPHLAAEAENKKIDPRKIIGSFKTLVKDFDFVIVEGVGGLLVPFDREKLVIDIAKELALPVIIVAKNRLGAINHTLLTIEALKTRRMKILGIIFNADENTNEAVQQDNPAIIEELTAEKILGSLPYLKDRDLLYKAFIPIGESIYRLLNIEEKNE